jgi:two-component system chemotaxis sensor kinase CheA
MTPDYSREPMMDMFIFETQQLIQQLEQSILSSEKSRDLKPEAIDEIFRIMHTIKGSSAMMFYNNIALLTHSVEDLFYFLRKEKVKSVDYSRLTDIVLEVIDFIKIEITKIQNGEDSNGDPSAQVKEINAFLDVLKQSNSSSLIVENVEHKSDTELESDEQKYYISHNNNLKSTAVNQYEVILFFEDGCEMENIRAFTVIHKLKELTEDIRFFPSDIIDNDDSIEVIRKLGFKIQFKTERSLEEMHSHFQETIFLKDLELNKLDKKVISLEGPLTNSPPELPIEHPGREEGQVNVSKQSIISVNVVKLDKLMDLVGEMVISEAMVTQNPELAGLELDSFHKASRQLKKITSELQDIVMSIRMVELSMTFQKLNRIVRDMCKKLNKEVELIVIGEETEVDKNIIEHISDPLMHLIRNSLDHGIELPEERILNGKAEIGKITLEARNAGSEVWIFVKDDGQGLDKQKILQKARENGLINRPESDFTDKEIYSFIFLPGFSTNEEVTEFSGRGVGMDVVAKNIQSLGGTVSVDSVPGKGSVITIKIPLTLAIIDGMTIKVGNLRYTVPTMSIKQSFKLNEGDVITDPDGGEMILIRGQCYRIVRLHEMFKVQTAITQLHDGIIMMVENDGKIFCLFADELIDKQQVVVKTLPSYIKKIKGIAGCTLLGDGNISLILDTSGLFHY